ncbi:MAG: ribonucleotide reductase N-terminal alpha domain-containing protein, partial [Planctomycetota bacterium]
MSGVASDQLLDVAAEAGGCRPDLAENGLRVLRARYLKKDERGRCLESPTDLFRRVAKAVADGELEHDR